jgi:predicted nucleotidyltransferase
MADRSTDAVPNGASSTALDVDRLRSALSDQPVRLAVLFGSQADGTADEASDVDVAVELDSSVDDRGKAKVALLTALSVELDRNDVDLSLVSDLDPDVGVAAFTDGILLYGSRDRYEALCARFEDRRSGDDRSLRERLDRTIENVDRLVEEGT